MAGSGVGTVSFKVTARVGKGEQVMVCGDSPFLGQGNPERALPLFTTPADYPLWFSKEDLPSPPGKRAGYEYRYCVFRGGRFHRWEAVERARLARPSKTPQVPRDSLDREPTADDNLDGHGHHGTSHEDFSRNLPGPPPPPQRSDGSEWKEREGGRGHGHSHGHHGDFSRNVISRPTTGVEAKESKDRLQGEREQGGAVVETTMTTSLQHGDRVSSPTGHRRPWDLAPTELTPASGDAPPGSAYNGASVQVGRPHPVVPAAAPFAGAGGRKLETPCFRAAKAAATAAAWLETQPEALSSHGVVALGDGVGESTGDAGEAPADAAVGRAGKDGKHGDKDGGGDGENGDGRGEKDKYGQDGIGDDEEDGDGAEEADGGDGLRSLQFGAEAVTRMERHQRQREEALPTNVLTLRRPPSLEAEEGEGAGLGLGLRLGADAMSSPPPRALEKARASPRPWSPRAGGVVVASFYLPVILKKRTAGATSAGAGGESMGVAGFGTQGWTAEWDYEQLVALQTKLRVVRVGTVKCDHHIGEEDRPAVVKALLKLNCVPVFLSEALAQKCYNGYCKGVLWPVMHSMLEIYDDLPNSLPDAESINTLWQAYKEVNRAFRDKVVEVFHEGDMIWVHGFHLAILPAFLDRTVKVARIGLFLHTPFPPSEVFRALPQRQELLRGMLGADQVGFHRFRDSRHFMSSCRRLLGLQHVYSQDTGLMQIAHGGKAVILTHRHAGVDPNAVRASLHKHESQQEEARLRALHRGRVVIGGVESVEKVKGVWLKMLAFGQMLERNPDLVGRVSMHEVGIANPAREADYRACQQMLPRVVDRLNTKHGEGTVVYEERQAEDNTLAQRAALMRACSVYVTTPLHNGLSTTPMEFRIVQEQALGVNSATGTETSRKAPGVLIISEAVSCSPALRGTFSVNPWKVESVAEAMAAALGAADADRVVWHQEDVEWCESNTTAAWAEDVLGVLSTVPKENRCRYATTGLGLTSRVVGTDPTFRRLDTNAARRAFSASQSRVFFLDYGGTLVKDTPRRPSAGGTTSKMDLSWTRFDEESKALPLRPGRPVLEGLEDLCRDPRNVVFVVSGRSRDELEEAFGHIKALGLAAEHGSWFRWPGAKSTEEGDAKEGKGDGDGGDDGGWEALHPGVKDTAWKNVARRFMQDFQLHTHGSYMEEKGTAMLWHYGNAEPEFGVMQAKQLQDELTDVLCSSSTSTTSVEGVAMGGVAGVGGVMASCVGGGESNALSCSTRSSSVASEACGAIDITHEEGRNSAQGGGGAYLEVRARGSSKGNFVHMVFSRMGWGSEGAGVEDQPSSGRFCLCVGDDVSDEDMFIAVKSYEGTPSSSQQDYSPTSGVGAAAGHVSGKENRTPGLGQGSGAKPREHQQQQQQQASFLTVTVGSKPSDASAWLPGVDAVVSLLRTLARMPTRRETAQISKVFPQALLMEARGELSVSPTRSLRAASTGNASSVMGHMNRVAEGIARAEAADSVNGVSSGVRAMNVGSGVPVVRRHSFTIGGKPRISLSLGEFLRVVAQPEPEPPMF